MFHYCLPYSAWADGNFAEAAGQLVKMVEHPNQSQPNLVGPRADGTPCTNPFITNKCDFQIAFIGQVKKRRICCLENVSGLSLKREFIHG